MQSNSISHTVEGLQSETTRTECHIGERVPDGSFTDAIAAPRGVSATQGGTNFNPWKIADEERRADPESEKRTRVDDLRMNIKDFFIHPFCSPLPVIVVLALGNAALSLCDGAGAVVMKIAANSHETLRYSEVTAYRGLVTGLWIAAAAGIASLFLPKYARSRSLAEITKDDDRGMQCLESLDTHLAKKLEMIARVRGVSNKELLSKAFVSELFAERDPNHRLAASRVLLSLMAQSGLRNTETYRLVCHCHILDGLQADKACSEVAHVSNLLSHRRLSPHFLSPEQKSLWIGQAVEALEARQNSHKQMFSGGVCRS